MMRFYRLLLLLALGLIPTQARALDVHSDGSDGVFAPTAATTTIDLGLAATGNWETTLGNGNGVYDPEKWAVVFKYSSVNIASGKTVKFLNHPSGAPVVWLVQGNITIAGAVDITGGALTANGSYAPGGPGGFAGGKGQTGPGSPSSAGLGPGGGGRNGTQSGAAGYAFAGSGNLPGVAYGNFRILPLIGGSGGGGSPNTSYSGGGGGGAILLASAATVSISGSINATGAGGYAAWTAGSGSGGGIRIIANQVAGTASGLSALGGAYGSSAAGSVGRIRIEANTINLTGPSSGPEYTWLAPLDNDTAVLWPPDTAPRIHVVTVGSQPVPADPRCQFNPPGDVLLVTTDPQPVVLQAYNVPTEPPNNRWLVKLRVVQRNGSSTTLDATLLSGDDQSSTWEATLTGIPLNDFVAVQARASAP